MSARHPGRPRRHPAAPQSGAARLTAYRQNLTASGLVRREVLVPTALLPQLEQVARDQQAGIGDTLSALLQYGAARYHESQTSSPLATATLPTTTPVVPVQTAPWSDPGHPRVSAAAPGESALAHFLRKRKES